MPLLQVSLANLAELDGGKANAAFMHELKRAAMDCEDRPGDKKPRKVTLEISLAPVVDQEGACDQVDANFVVRSKVPERKTRPYNFDLRKGGMLVFSSSSPTNVDQYTFDDLDPATGLINRPDPTDA